MNPLHQPPATVFEEFKKNKSKQFIDLFNKISGNKFGLLVVTILLITILGIQMNDT